MTFRLAAITAIATVATACSVVSGTALPEPIDLDSLDTGPYPTQPRQYKFDDFALGANAAPESQRMLNYLVQPTDIAAELTWLSELGLINSADDARRILPAYFLPVTTGQRMIAAVYSARTNGRPRERSTMIVLVMRFPTPESAQVAVGELNAATIVDNPTLPPVAIPGYPEAAAAGGSAIVSFVPHGPYVVGVNLAIAGRTPDELTELIRQALDRQLSLLDSQEPTPVDDILDLPPDRDGMLARTLPYSVEHPSAADVAVYETTGAIHFEPDAAAAAAAFEHAGVDLVARHDAVVYRAENPDRAAELADDLASIATESADVVAGPATLPPSQCFEYRTTEPYGRSGSLECLIVVDRYVASVAARDTAELKMKSAAQYAILTRSVAR